MALPKMAVALGLALVTGAAAAAPAGHDCLFVQATMTKDIWVVDAETFETVDRTPSLHLAARMRAKPLTTPGSASVTARPMTFRAASATARPGATCR